MAENTQVQVPSRPALTTAEIVGGVTSLNSGWDEPLWWLGNRIRAKADGVFSPISVNIEFHIPGDLLKPDYVGERTGAFRKSDSLLKVQVALPEAPPAEVRAYLKARVLSAVGEAERWAIARRRATDLASLRELAGEI
jgi:hypothetical protein